MHQKKSEVQIGTDSSGFSSDFNPIPPFLSPPILTQKHQIFDFESTPLSIDLENGRNFGSIASPSSSSTTPKNPLLSTPHKRPLMNQSLSIVKSPTLPTSLHQYPFSATPTSNFKSLSLNSRHPSLFLVISSAKSKVFRLIWRLRVHLRLLLLLALPFFYFLVSHPSRSFILDFLSAFAFSAALLFSLHLALPRLPSIRVFLNRSFPFPIKLSARSAVSRPLPVFWSIGSKPKAEKRVNSGCCVQVYSNGDVYEGEFHKGKCSGSGVYYYYMSGRYEGDWVDGKYDGFGVETWAKGSRYRGQYRNGLRHGIGVYKFYTGDVYEGEWSNGQSRGFGVYSSKDGCKYVGEFKWGVKHGVGHYHYRNGDVYAGEYFADKMHGFGVYKFVNGHQYEGSWHEGRRQGLGVYTFRNGEIQSGYWHNGLLDKTGNQAQQPGSPSSPTSCKISNAIEEARQASKKAYSMATVDARVNKVVGAANQAANAARVAAVKAVQTRMYQGTTNDGSLLLSL